MSVSLSLSLALRFMLWSIYLGGQVQSDCWGRSWRKPFDQDCKVVICLSGFVPISREVYYHLLDCISLLCTRILALHLVLP